MKRELTVDLFEWEQRRERRERFLRLVGVSLFAMVAVSFGQDAAFVKSMNLTVTEAIKYLKIAANVILFFMFFAKLIPALTGGQKETNWWELVGIVAAVAIVNSALPIYNAITAQNVGGN